jgi:hypothetical protein
MFKSYHRDCGPVSTRSRSAGVPHSRRASVFAARVGRRNANNPEAVEPFYRTWGKPRSTLLDPGSGQRLVTTFARV